MLLDDGTVVAGTVRYFRTCDDYGWADGHGLGNHFLGGGSGAVGHLPKPAGFAYADGSVPVGMPPCGDCPDDAPFWPDCGICAGLTALAHYVITGPASGVDLNLNMSFRCDGSPKYTPDTPVTDTLGFRLLECYFAVDLAFCTFRFLAPDGSTFSVDTDFYLSSCPHGQWDRVLFTPVPTLGAGWFLDIGFHFL